MDKPPSTHDLFVIPLFGEIGASSQYLMKMIVEDRVVEHFNCERSQEQLLTSLNPPLSVIAISSPQVVFSTQVLVTHTFGPAVVDTNFIWVYKFASRVSGHVGNPPMIALLLAPLTERGPPLNG
jgi:hypothetical protein